MTLEIDWKSDRKSDRKVTSKPTSKTTSIYDWFMIEIMIDLWLIYDWKFVSVDNKFIN